MLRGPCPGSLHKCEKLGPLFWVPLVFTCTLKGLLSLCPVNPGQSSTTRETTG